MVTAVCTSAQSYTKTRTDAHGHPLLFDCVFVFRLPMSDARTRDAHQKRNMCARLVWAPCTVFGVQIPHGAPELRVCCKARRSGGKSRRLHPALLCRAAGGWWLLSAPRSQQRLPFQSSLPHNKCSARRAVRHCCKLRAAWGDDGIPRMALARKSPGPPPHTKFCARSAQEHASITGRTTCIIWPAPKPRQPARVPAWREALRWGPPILGADATALGGGALLRTAPKGSTRHDLFSAP